MTVTRFLLLAMALIGSAESEDLPTPTETFPCPVLDGKFQEGYFANPSSCTRYYVCDAQGKAYESDCGDHGTFDPDSQTCKLMEQMRCRGGLRGDDVVDPPATTSAPEETSNATTASSTQVETNNTTTASSTPEETNATTTASSTSEETNATTAAPSIPEETTAIPATTSESPATVAAAKEGKVSAEGSVEGRDWEKSTEAAPGDAREEKVTTAAAPAGEENFAKATTEPTTPLTEAASDEERLNSDDVNFVGEKKPYEEPLFPNRKCEDLDDGKYLVPDRGCQLYVDCRSGRSTHPSAAVLCPAHTTFDERIQECTHEARNSDARCPGSARRREAFLQKHQELELDKKHFLLDYDAVEIPGDREREEEEREFCSIYGNAGKQLTVNKDCHKFRVCDGSHKIRVFSCAPFTSFDDAVGDCVVHTTNLRPECRGDRQDAQLFSCPSRDELSTIIHDRLERTGEGTFATFPHPDDCAKFFTCHLEETVVQKTASCSAPDVFDPQEARCRHYSNVEACRNYYIQS